jgi:hypothetical protein
VLCAEEKHVMLLDDDEREPIQHSADRTPYATVPVRTWWDGADEPSQMAVLRRLNFPAGLAGVPWPFLPPAVQATMTRRVRVDPTRLGKDEG